jgi:hypothetical protein
MSGYMGVDGPDLLSGSYPCSPAHDNKSFQYKGRRTARETASMKSEPEHYGEFFPFLKLSPLFSPNFQSVLL